MNRFERQLGTGRFPAAVVARWREVEHDKPPAICWMATGGDDLVSAMGEKRTLAKDDWEVGVTRPQVAKAACISLAALGVGRSRAWL
jgi:hypothetical protein